MIIIQNIPQMVLYIYYLQKSQTIYNKVTKWAKLAHEILGCSGISEVIFDLMILIIIYICLK